MKPINVLIAKGTITKSGTLAMIFHKPVVEENPYIWFGYGPLIIYHHTRGQVSVPMNDDPINMIHTSQQSTKKGLKNILKDILENPENNTQWINNWINKENFYRFNFSSRNEESSKIM